MTIDYESMVEEDLSNIDIDSLIEEAVDRGFVVVQSRNMIAKRLFKKPFKALSLHDCQLVNSIYFNQLEAKEEKNDN